MINEVQESDAQKACSYYVTDYNIRHKPKMIKLLYVSRETYTSDNQQLKPKPNSAIWSTNALQVYED